MISRCSGVYPCSGTNFLLEYVFIRWANLLKVSYNQFIQLFDRQKLYG